MGGQPHDVLVPRMSALRRVGHKGADLIAPGNTRESFDAALQAGVDMIEFDVLPATLPADDDTPLILAHDHEHGTDDAPSLDEGLAHLRSDAFADVELDVDLKLPGYEERVVAALRDHDLVDRTLVSSQYMRSLVKIRAIEPRLRLGWSVPRVRRDYTKSIVFVIPALSALFYMRRRLPGLAAGHIGEGRVDAVLAHYRLATPELAQAVHDAGARARRPRCGRRAVRVDGRRRRAHPPARGDGRRRRHHERSAAVRLIAYSMRQVAALKSGGSAPSVERCPPSVTRLARRTARPLRAQR